LLAVIAWFRPLGRKRQLNASALAAIAIGAILLARWSSRWLNPLPASVLRDWLPVPLMLFPYWQVGQFFTGVNPGTEKRLGHLDHALFPTIRISPANAATSPGQELRRRS